MGGCATAPRCARKVHFSHVKCQTFHMWNCVELNTAILMIFIGTFFAYTSKCPLAMRCPKRKRKRKVDASYCVQRSTRRR